MLETFKARLKAKTTAAGVNLSKERITAIADRLHKKFPELTEEADHDARLDELNELTPFDEIAKSDDKIRTLEAKTKGQQSGQQQQNQNEENKGQQQQQNDDEPAWFKAYRQQTDAKIAAFEKEKTVGSIKQQLAAKLKDVPANYYENWQLPDNENDLDAFAEKVNTGYTTLTQGLVEKGLVAPGIPASGIPAAGGASKKIDPAIAGFVKAKQAATQQTK